MEMAEFKKINRGHAGSSGGFIKTIVIVILALVLLKYALNIDVVGYLTQGKWRELLDQFYKLGSEGWEKYKDTIIKIWNYAAEFIKTRLGK
jgi:hypothetical protein